MVLKTSPISLIIPFGGEQVVEGYHTAHEFVKAYLKVNDGCPGC
jgi:hypothetical protein